MKTVAIVPSAGKGKRLNLKREKPFIKIHGKPLIIHTLGVLEKSKHIDEIVLAVAGNRIKIYESLARKYHISKVKHIVKGGSIRAYSVQNGLKKIGNAGIILIHDGARPCIDDKIIGESIRSAKKNGASCVCVPVKPTIKMVSGKYISKTIDRKRLWEAQTPQVFKKEIILKAFRNKKSVKDATDDAGLVEKMGGKVAIVKGSYRNIKVTTQEDLEIVGHYLK